MRRHWNVYTLAHSSSNCASAPSIARNRGNASFVLANGRGAAIDRTSALSRAPFIAVAELTGTAAQGRILLAAPITQAEIEAHFADQIETVDEISFDHGAMALRARHRKTLHALTLSEAPLALRLSEETARILGDGLIAAGLDQLPWSKPARQWRDRVMFLRKAEGEGVENLWPDVSDAALAAQRETWLTPMLYEKASLREISSGELSDALVTLLPRELRARLDREFHFRETGNAEILCQWLLMAVKAHYEPAFPALEGFLCSVGRRKFLKPLYTALLKTPEGSERARAIYAKARPGYHPIARNTIDAMVGKP